MIFIQNITAGLYWTIKLLVSYITLTSWVGVHSWVGECVCLHIYSPGGISITHFVHVVAGIIWIFIASSLIPWLHSQCIRSCIQSWPQLILAVGYKDSCISTNMADNLILTVLKCCYLRVEIINQLAIKIWHGAQLFSHIKLCNVLGKLSGFWDFFLPLEGFLD